MPHQKEPPQWDAAARQDSFAKNEPVHNRNSSTAQAAPAPPQDLFVTDIDTGSRNLTRYETACRALAEARSVDEVKHIRDQAVALRVYAKQAKNRQLEADAFEIRLRAEKRVGEMMEAQPKAKPPGANQYVDRVSEKPEAPATLAEAGIDKNLANRARKLHALPSSEFERVLADGRQTIERGVERQVLRAVEIAAARKTYDARKEQGGTVADLEALAANGKKFGVVYVDPPWSFEVYSGKGKQRAAARHYDVMSLGSIKTLPIADLAATDCALFLWSVWPRLPDALEVIAAWGFEFKTAAFVWVKQNRGGEGLFTGMGFWTRANTEPCLLATRGSPLRLAADVHQVILSPVREHSRKPDEVRSRIERLVAGPYLELFGREQAPGWIVWGNEIPAPVDAAPVDDGIEIPSPVAAPVDDPSPAPAPVDDGLDIPPIFLRRRAR
jgi:N6-adenosine-specific RNA methylase IME4